MMGDYQSINYIQKIPYREINQTNEQSKIDTSHEINTTQINTTNQNNWGETNNATKRNTRS